MTEKERKAIYVKKGKPNGQNGWQITEKEKRRKEEQQGIEENVGEENTS